MLGVWSREREGSEEGQVPAQSQQLAVILLFYPTRLRIHAALGRLHSATVGMLWYILLSLGYERFGT